MIKSLFKTALSKTLLVFYILLVGFWAWININGFRDLPINNLFGTLYPIISLTGGTYGLFVVAKKWGGFKSLVGRGLSFLSIGLYALSFGQLTWSFYTIILKAELPYPSIADIGYFSIILCYGYAMYNFAKASGISISLRNFTGKLQIMIIPAAMLIVAYVLFLKNLPVDLSNPIRTFLDWGTPAFDAVNISIAILTYNLSKKFLGGRMKSRVLFLVVALVAEYLAEYSFLYRAGMGTYYNAGFVDLMFTTSVFLMSLGIIQFNDYEE